MSRLPKLSSIVQVKWEHSYIILREGNQIATKSVILAFIYCKSSCNILFGFFFIHLVARELDSLPFYRLEIFFEFVFLFLKFFVWNIFFLFFNFRVRSKLAYFELVSIPTFVVLLVYLASLFFSYLFFCFLYQLKYWF